MRRRYRLLTGYTLAVGVGLFMLGLFGMAPSPPSPLNPTFPENLLHISAGLLFVGGVLVTDRLEQLRVFVRGLGGLLVLSKVIILSVRWAEPGVHLHVPLVGVVCLVAGVGSVLITAFVSTETPPEDYPPRTTSRRRSWWGRFFGL